ncbi:MAG: tetratricopeptide repeat protein, partial [Chloroflexi bacterium]|nr:tetratricopeptide repeat protein [Chloroflexota bacterium]
LGLDACRKLKDERSAIAIVSSLGLVYQRRGDWQQAVEFYRNAMTQMEGFGTEAGMAEVYMHLGTTLTQQENWNRALAALTKSMQIRQKLGDARGIAETRANLGMLYAKHGETVKARALWNQALEVLDSLGSRSEADIVRRWLKSLPRDR